MTVIIQDHKTTRIFLTWTVPWDQSSFALRDEAPFCACYRTFELAQMKASFDIYVHYVNTGKVMSLRGEVGCFLLESVTQVTILRRII